MGLHKNYNVLNFRCLTSGHGSLQHVNKQNCRNCSVVQNSCSPNFNHFFSSTDITSCPVILPLILGKNAHALTINVPSSKTGGRICYSSRWHLVGWVLATVTRPAGNRQIETRRLATRTKCFRLLQFPNCITRADFHRPRSMRQKYWLFLWWGLIVSLLSNFLFLFFRLLFSFYDQKNKGIG